MSMLSTMVVLLRVLRALRGSESSFYHNERDAATDRDQNLRRRTRFEQIVCSTAAPGCESASALRGGKTAALGRLGISHLFLGALRKDTLDLDTNLVRN